ncbi:cytochrome c3 family protein [Longilinea arvoryzae]|nr:cytochrome c3 family protein [Longilinea arvoryzae]
MTLVLVCAAVLAVSNGTVQAAPQTQQPDNSKCLLCHQEEGKTLEFPSGEALSVVISPEMFGGSVHVNLACQTCHINIADFPHPENSAQTAREYTLQYQNTCLQCHPDQAAETADNAHAKARNDPNNPNAQNAPTCVDCHNPHTQTVIQKDEKGRLNGLELAASAKTCAKCHNQIYQEYSQSVHGEGLLVNNNPDVPTCIDCHGVHNLSGPSSSGSQFRLSSPQICAKCHTDESIMGKYGISTQVLNTYIADFHGTTVTLFEKLDPDQQTNMPVCFDCHGVHNIQRVDDPTKGLEIKENLLVTCKKCHPDATPNFPASWLSHYIPSKDHAPLVFYVGWFYKILIPLVLGGMLVLVGSDVYRKVKRRKAKSAPAESDGEAGQEGGSAK